jgi:hypothetical protein
MTINSARLGVVGLVALTVRLLELDNGRDDHIAR